MSSVYYCTIYLSPTASRREYKGKHWVSLLTGRDSVLRQQLMLHTYGYEQYSRNPELGSRQFLNVARTSQ